MKQIKIFWNEDEEKLVAAAFCAIRLKDPFAFPQPIFNEAMQALPEHRRRPSTVFANAHSVKRRIAGNWREIQQIAAPAPPTEPELQIIEIEKPIERSQTEILASLPTAVLRAELYSRDEEKADAAARRFEAVLSALHTSKNGSISSHAPVSSLHGTSGGAKALLPRRKPRIALLVPTARQFEEIQQQAASYEFPVDLRFVDTTKRERLVGQFEFVIMDKNVSHKWWDQCKKNQKLDGSRIKFVDSGMTGFMQALRDIGSMQPKY